VDQLTFQVHHLDTNQYDDYFYSIKWKGDQKHPDEDWHHKEDLSWPFFIHWPEITIMTNIEENIYFSHLRESITDRRRKKSDILMIINKELWPFFILLFVGHHDMIS
jgi:hypothetical protein